MANVTLVTNHCYLQCQSINFIAINELGHEDEGSSNIFSMSPSKRKSSFKRGSKRKQQRPERKFQIIIDFIPVAQHSGGSISGRSHDAAQVAITVTGHNVCTQLFATIVHQIREQLPDELFLNHLVDTFLTENQLVVTK